MQTQQREKISARKPVASKALVQKKQSDFVTAYRLIQNAFNQLKESVAVKMRDVEIKVTYFCDDDLRPSLTSWGTTGVRSIDIRHCIGSGARHEGWLFYNRQARKKCFAYFTTTAPVVMRVVYMTGDKEPKEQVHVVKDLQFHGNVFVNTVANLITGYMLAQYQPGFAAIPLGIAEFKSKLDTHYRGQSRIKVFKNEDIPKVYRTESLPIVSTHSYEVSFLTSAVPRFLFVHDFEGKADLFHVGIISEAGQPAVWEKISFNDNTTGVRRYYADLLVNEYLGHVRRKLG